MEKIKKTQCIYPNSTIPLIYKIPYMTCDFKYINNELYLECDGQSLFKKYLRKQKVSDKKYNFIIDNDTDIWDYKE